MTLEDASSGNLGVRSLGLGLVIDFDVRKIVLDLIETLKIDFL